MDVDLTLTTELRLLTYSAFLCLVIWIPYILAVIKVRGLSGALGYPTGSAEDLPAWGQRSQRAHLNLVENLAPFAVFVLVAHTIGVSNGVTVLGAQLFFWARIAHFVLMFAGIAWLRTAAFATGVVGNLLIFSQILFT